MQVNKRIYVSLDIYITNTFTVKSQCIISASIILKVFSRVEMLVAKTTLEYEYTLESSYVNKYDDNIYLKVCI